MPMERRRNELRHLARPEAEIDRQIDAGLAGTPVMLERHEGDGSDS
jgi:hypothetical protein